VCLLIVVLIAYRTRGGSFRWDLFIATLDQVNWRRMVVAICLILLSFVGRALRWQRMLIPLGRPIPLWRLTSDTLIGATAGLLLGRVGEFVRPYLISVQTGLPISSQAAAWFLERVLDLLALLLLCAYAFIAMPMGGLHASPPVLDALKAGGYSLALSGFVCLAFLFAFRDPNGWAQRRIRNALTVLAEHHHHRVVRIMESFSRGLESTRQARSLVILLGFTALEWGIIVAGSFAMFRSFAVTSHFSLIQVLVLLTVISLGNLIQLPGIGGGLQAACIVGLNSLYGVPIEAASGVALLLWFFGSFCYVPFGLLGAFHEGLNWSKLKLLSTQKILDPDA
jgi:glycosyltransferase 2 family protein